MLGFYDPTGRAQGLCKLDKQAPDPLTCIHSPFCFPLVDTRSQVAQAGSQLTTSLKMTLPSAKSWDYSRVPYASSCGAED